MGEDSTNAEIQQCGRQMRNGKAAGVDGFLAEFYQYGTQDLRRRSMIALGKCGVRLGRL